MNLLCGGMSNQQNQPPPFETINPEWARPADVTKMFGIKRSSLWELMRTGAIKSVSLRKKYQIRGTRLINVQSVRDFISAQEVGSTLK